MMIRSLFFAPANRHDLLAKFPRFGADCCVLDLEDGTPLTDKASARARLGEAIGMLRHVGLRSLVFVRINDLASPFHSDDLAAALRCDVDGIILPKIERPEDAGRIASAVAATAAQRSASRTMHLMGGIESMLGVVNAIAICKSDAILTSVYFGAEDYAADLGARRTRDGNEVLYARSQVVLAARLAGVLAIDQAVTEIRDNEHCRQDAEQGRNLGYQGKICLTPGQVTVCNSVFSPSDAEVEHAEALLATYEMAQRQGKGTIDFRGQMVDTPLVKRAQAIVANARQVRQAATF